MSNFTNKKKISFKFKKSYLNNLKNIKQLEKIPFLTSLYNEYDTQNMIYNNNLGLYTYWSDYHNITDKNLKKDILIDEYNININSSDRDLNYNENPLYFSVWLNQQGRDKSVLPHIFKNIKYINLEHIIFPKYIQLNKYNITNDLSFNNIKTEIGNIFISDTRLNNLNRINTSILTYQICNVIYNNYNDFEVNFTIDYIKDITYSFSYINSIIILNKFEPICIYTYNNYIQYLCIDPTTNYFMFNTKNKSIFMPIFPKLNKHTSLYLAIKKSLIVYNNTNLLNIYKINVKILNSNYDEIVIKNLDYTLTNNTCNCSFDNIKYSCKCYYLRHPLNSNFQIDLFIKIGSLIQDFNKVNYIY
jgi:hypothetical protein